MARAARVRQGGESEPGRPERLWAAREGPGRLGRSVVWWIWKIAALYQKFGPSVRKAGTSGGWRILAPGTKWLFR